MERFQNPKMRQRGLSDNESTCRIKAVCKDHPWRKSNIIERLAIDLRPVFATLLISCLAVLFGVPASGQNVTISPSSGHLIAGLTYSGEVGFEEGWSSLWRHNQLPLTLLVSDKSDLTSSGVLKDPAGNISYDKDQKLYVVQSGSPKTTDLHMCISLPKGYRFTGYRIVLLNNMNGKLFNNTNEDYTYGKVEKKFYETDSTFSTTVPSGYPSPLTLPKTNDEKEYVMERTSKSETDMGNNLYFLLDHDDEAFYAVTIKSIELYFTAEAPFQAEGVPGSPAEIISKGVNMVGSNFTTGKLDLGKIKPNTKNGSTYFSYDYMNVIDLTAQNWLYQEEAVSDGKLPKNASDGKIQVLKNGNSLYYALDNGTYYIETPTEAKDQEGKTIPLAYRITGAQIKAHYGTKAGSSSVSYDTNTGTITYQVGSGRRATTYYLQPDGKWSSSNQTSWTLTKNNKLQCGGYYLVVKKGTYTYRWQDYDIYYTTNSDNINDASSFTVSGGKIIWEEMYLSYDDTFDNAVFYSSSDYAANWTADQTSTTNPAYTPSPFQLNLYGTNGSTVEKTMNVSNGDTKDPTIEVTGLNNDAVKFTISGLTGDAKALITYELTMEQLNPFINTLDIVCHSTKAEGLKVTQQFTSNDFQVAGGVFHFYVPSSVADASHDCRFTFENLKSKYMDDTYGYNTNGNSRNYFVKSEYYDKYGDGKQYDAPADADPATKVSTSECGNQAFKYNNAADLDASGTTKDATTLEEYPYSKASYEAQGGTFTKDIVLAVDKSKDCYLFTGDETRYNIAPTTAMEHRAYAFYLMQIDLQVKDYNAKCNLTKLYNKTFYGENDEKAMYGGVFKAYDQSGNEVSGKQAYVTVSTMKKALDNLQDEETNKKISCDQILYLDFTNLYSVVIEDKSELDKIKEGLNPNCLIFLPENTIYAKDNYVSKTKSGDFRACNNIILTDKQPFYSPYKISVPAENYAKYTRNITVSKYGKAQNATLMLPFELSIDDKGVHTNSGEAGDKLSFSVNTLQKTNCISNDQKGDEINEGKGWYVHFVPYTSSTNHTEANVPYMIHVTDAPTDKDVSFTALQYGSDIMPTQVGQDGTMTMKEKCTGTYDGHNITLTPTATYSGTQVDKNKNKCFYWGNNVFNSSWTLSSRYNAVKVMPFRAWLACEGISPAKAATLHAVFGENTTPATGISNVEQSSDGLKIEGTVGALTIVSPTDRTLDIRNTQGMLIKRVTLRAGERDITSLSSGIYLVAGKKVIVK